LELEKEQDTMSEYSPADDTVNRKRRHYYQEGVASRLQNDGLIKLRTIEGENLKEKKGR
jgi:hypothetical protein